MSEPLYILVCVTCGSVQVGVAHEPLRVGGDALLAHALQAPVAVQLLCNQVRRFEQVN